MVAKNRNTATVAAASAAMISLPRAVGASPAARWGHQAVYVKSQKAMYILGGEVSASGSQITNEVLILPLNSTSPSFTTGSSEGLPPHAFAAAALSSDESSLVLVGGMTSDCSSDGLAHTLDLSGDDGWTSTTPSKLSRRRGAQSAWVDNTSVNGEIMVVGGIADSYSCANSTSVYTASDILSLPLSTSALVSSRSLPSSLTGSTLAVSDFGLASDSSGKIYLAGGQSSSGDLVSLDTIGVWDSTNGWQSQSTTGDVPDGRLGASLVAHPSLDVLVLHGGLVANTTSGSYTSSHLLALLNTTSFEWSTPSDLQPDSSSAASYHSAVMTDEGVMISAFGLSATNTPRSDVTYLDLRDTSQGAWTWESSWNSNMLNAYSTDTSTSANGATAASSTGGVTAADAKTSSGTSSKKLASIIVPVLVVALLILPIIVYLVRRRMRVMKKRRMARHFSFSSQEESGAFTSPFDQYLAKRRSQAQWPFGGQDANEQGGGIVGGVTGSLGRMVSRISNRSSEDEHNNMEEGERQMAQVGQRVRVNADGQQPMNWEEIDFGLGKLDESKNHDSSHIASSGAPVRDDRDLTVRTTTAGGYSDDVLYAAAEAKTPNSHVFGDEHAVSQPANTLSSAYPAIEPTPACTAVASDGDWNQLEQSLSSKPAFRSISPTAQLRSHAHLGSPSTPSSPTPPTTAAVQRTASLTRTVSQASTVPSIPPFEFERTESPGGTITLINPKDNSEAKEPETLPFSNKPKRLSGTPHRSVSQPISRQLAGGLSRRGSAPSSSGSEDGQSPKLSGVSGGQTAPQKMRAVSASHAAPSRKASLSSNGSVKYPSASKRRTQLRVVNMAEADEEDQV